MQEADSALDSVINSTIDSATQSAQNDAIQNPQQSQNLQTPQTQNSTISQTLANIKIKIFIFIGLLVVSAFIDTFSKLFLSGFLLFIAICVCFGAGCVLHSAIETLCERAKSKILKDSVDSYIVASIIGWGGLFLFSALAKVGSRASDNNGFLIALFCLLILSFLVYSIILRYRIYKEVAYITNQPLFLVAFWLGVTILLSPIAVIVYIVAWIMVKKIRQSASTGEYK